MAGAFVHFRRAVVAADLLRAERAQLADVLAAATAQIPMDVAPYSELYAIANAVGGIDPGAYRFAPPGGFELLRRGDFRLEAGFLVLEQPLGALAAATTFVMAELERVLAAHGNRGYRAAHLEAGIRTGRIYLGDFARGFGATASTFYDVEVSRFFGTPQLSPLLAAAVGYSRR